MSVGTVYRVKRMLCQTSLLTLAVSFEFLSKHSPEVQRELSSWEEGRILSLGVLPDGPAIAVKKTGGRLVYLGTGHHNSSLKILFKNPDAALMTLLGFIGAHTAFAEHRAIVHGSLDQAMEANRVMALVVKFLMPGLILKRIMRRYPKFTGQDYLVKAMLMGILTPLLVANALK